MQSNYQDLSDTPFSIAAGQIRLQLEQSDEGMMLVKLMDAEGRNYLRRPNLLWKIEMINRDHKQVELSMRQSHPRIRRGSEKVRVIWPNIPIGNTSDCVTVKATICFDDDSGEISWKLRVEDVPDGWSVFRVHFPRLDLAVDRGSESTAIILPYDRGVIYRNPLETMPTGGMQEKLRRRPYPHGGHTMQFLAMEQGDQLLYLGAHDPIGHLKTFFVGPDPENELIYVHPYVDTEIHYGEDWSQPYSWIIRLQRGDWYDAARIYREFAMTASWTQKGPLATEAKTPLWYQQIGLVALRKTRGPGFEDEDILAESNYLGTPMVCHYYMWHQSAFDANYPLMFPAVPGFRDTIKTLESNGIRVMPYVNGFSGDMHMDAWEQGLKGSAAKITPAGKYDLHVWSQNRTFATLCPAAAMPRQLMTMAAIRLFDQGVSAVYFDEIGASAPWPCYDTKHKHPPGGGATFVTSMNETLRLVREQALEVNTEPILTTEGCAEPYMANLDAMLIGNPNLPNAIPLFEVVYHDHVMGFGRYTFTPELMDPSFAGAIESKHAQQLVWGTQFGWSGVPISRIIKKSPGTAAFLRHLAHVWKHNYDFLAQGKMLRPLDLSDQLEPISRRWAMSWRDETGTVIPMMPVLNSVWQRIDGTIGVVLANITSKPIAVTIRLPSTQDMYAQAMEQGVPANIEEAVLSHLYPLPQRAEAEVRTLVGDDLNTAVAEGDSEAGFPVRIKPMSVIVLAIGSEKQYGLA